MGVPIGVLIMGSWNPADAGIHSKSNSFEPSVLVDVQSHVHAHVGLVLGGGLTLQWSVCSLCVHFVIFHHSNNFIPLMPKVGIMVLSFRHPRQPLRTYEMKRVSALLSLSAENPPVTDWFVPERASKSGLWYYFSTWTIHFTNSRVAGVLGAHVMHSMGLYYLICLPGHRMPDSVSINSVSRL